MRNVVVVAACLLIALTIYFPALSLHFASDDFKVIKRICVDGAFWVPGFFRPLGDVLLLFDYHRAGFDPSAFHFTNILIHSANGFMVFVLARSLPFTASKQTAFFPYLACLLFLSYPFHSESVLWIVSRSSSLGAFFGFLSLIFFFRIRNNFGVLLVALSYSLGLMSFENIFLLPVIISVFEIFYFRIWRKLIVWVPVFTTSIILHFVFRWIFSGAIWGSYGGKGLFSAPINEYPIKMVKAFGRLWLPPMGNSLLMVVLFFLSIIGVGILLFRIFNSNQWVRQEQPLFFSLLLSLFISMTIPFMFGVSTHTSEGGRLLYFPSVFFVLLLSWFITRALHSQLIQVAVAILCLAANLYMVSNIIYNWKKASGIILSVRKIVEKVDNQVAIINLPGEYDGAYVFRVGIESAPTIWGMPNKRILVGNILNKQVEIDNLHVYGLKHTSKSVFLEPETYLFATDNFITIKSKSSFIFDKSVPIIFWNNKEFKKVPIR